MFFQYLSRFMHPNARMDAVYRAYASGFISWGTFKRRYVWAWLTGGRRIR